MERTRKKLTEVVGDDDDTTRELLDGLGKRIDGCHVQVICGLVKHQDVRVFHGQLREDDTARHEHFRYSQIIPSSIPIPQTIGELRYRVSLMSATETESSKLCSPRLHILFGILFREYALHKDKQRKMSQRRARTWKYSIGVLS